MAPKSIPSRRDPFGTPKRTVFRKKCGAARAACCAKRTALHHWSVRVSSVSGCMHDPAGTRVSMGPGSPMKLRRRTVSVFSIRCVSMVSGGCSATGSRRLRRNSSIPSGASAPEEDDAASDVHLDELATRLRADPARKPIATAATREPVRCRRPNRRKSGRKPLKS